MCEYYRLNLDKKSACCACESEAHFHLLEILKPTRQLSIHTLSFKTDLNNNKKCLIIWVIKPKFYSLMDQHNTCSLNSNIKHKNNSRSISTKCHQVIVLCNSSGCWHMTKSANLIGWLFSSQCDGKDIRTPLLHWQQAKCSCHSEQMH